EWYDKYEYCVFVQGLNAIRHVVKDALDKRMTNWEKYCFQHCFYLPEGFVVPEDANKESEDLQRELSTLERQATYKRKLDSAVAEIQKLFEDKFVQQNFE
ncbi:hypothetical protein U9M48_039167, partial [Paspalum notatum var. saurae]